MRFAGFIPGLLIAVAASHAEPRLRMLSASSNGWAAVQGETPVSHMFITLSASSNLTHWQTIAELDAASFVFIDPASARHPRRYYRFVAESQSARNYKNQVTFRTDSYVTGHEGLSDDWVKFIILFDEPDRVFYTHAGYPFHYDFARTMPQFQGMNPAEFERAVAGGSAVLHATPARVKAAITTTL